MCAFVAFRMALQIRHVQCCRALTTLNRDGAGTPATPANQRHGGYATCVSAVAGDGQREVASIRSKKACTNTAVPLCRRPRGGGYSAALAPCLSAGRCRGVDDRRNLLRWFACPYCKGHVCPGEGSCVLYSNPMQREVRPCSRPAWTGACTDLYVLAALRHCHRHRR